MQDVDFNNFISTEKNKVYAFLKRKFPLYSDDELDDIYQESSIALFSNMREGKLNVLTCTLFTYFLRICINQALKLSNKKQKVVPLFDDRRLVNKDDFRSDKIDELYGLCTEDEEEEMVSRSERIVREIIEMMPDTCKNIFRGYYWDNLTTTTIADMFGFANANSVKTQKYKCLQKFRNKYHELMNRNNG